MTLFQRPSRRWVTRIAIGAMAAASIPLFVAGQANASTATCKADTTVFDARTNGDLWLYQNNTQVMPNAMWTDVHQIGTGWQGRTLASANGDIFGIAPNGNLNFLHYDVNTDQWSNNGTASTIGQGWSRYLPGAAAAKQITVDATGQIFIVDPDGNLRSYYYNTKTSSFVNGGGTVIDSGWNRYTRIFSAGPNVLYAVDGPGNLFRFDYDPVAQRFTEYADQIGSDWGNAVNVFSPGADVIYVIDQSGNLSWYRFDDDTQAWADGGVGSVVGTGWKANVLDVSATTNTCTTDPVSG